MFGSNFLMTLLQFQVVSSVLVPVISHDMKAESLKRNFCSDFSYYCNYEIIPASIFFGCSAVLSLTNMVACEGFLSRLVGSSHAPTVSLVFSRTSVYLLCELLSVFLEYNSCVIC